MIGKVVKPGKGFGGLTRYLLHGPKDKTSDQSRVAWSATRNLAASDPAKASALMKATAVKSKKVNAPVYHVVVSWRRDENPSDQVMEQVADTLCADLGLDDYQRLYVAHDDTHHRHVHVVINRVHPETGVAWRMSHDFRRIEQSLFRQSMKLGFEPVPGRHTTKLQANLKSRRPTTAELRKANREGQPAPSRWTIPQLADHQALLRTLVDTASSWQHLHDGLRPIGITLVPKGMGLVFRDANGDMKLSDLGKGYRMGLLEDRFGTAYEAPSAVSTPAPSRPTPRLKRPSPIQPASLAGDTIAMQTAITAADMRAALVQHRLGLAPDGAVEDAQLAQTQADAVAKQAPIAPQSSNLMVRRRKRQNRRERER